MLYLSENTIFVFKVWVLVSLGVYGLGSQVTRGLTLREGFMIHV